MLLEKAIEISQLLNEVRALNGTRIAGPENRVVPEKKSNIATEQPIIAPQPSPQPLISKVKKEEPKPATPEVKETLDAETVAHRWLSFGEFLKTKSRPLHSILPDLEFCGVRRSTIYLAVPGNIEKNMLSNMKDEMTLALREFFGAPLTFEAGPKSEMQVKAGSPVVINPEIVKQTVKPKTEERSELERALMEKLGAQEV